MLIWVAILVRGMWRRLPGEHPGNMPYLFLYSALSIPVFYAAGMVIGSNANFAERWLSSKSADQRSHS